MSDPHVAAVKEALNHELNLIAELFKPGAKLTLIIRTPSVGDEADIFMTNDDLDEIINAAKRRQKAETPTDG